MSDRKLIDGEFKKWKENKWESVYPAFEKIIDESATIDDLLLKGLILYEKAHQDLRKQYNAKLYAELNYNDRANALRLDVNQIKEDLDLSKAPTEKQTQSYIDKKLRREYGELLISKNGVKLLERQIECYNEIVSCLFNLMELKKRERGCDF